jgi:flagellar biosynthesis GTPase FlhF
MSQDYFEPINWGNKKNKKKTATKSFRGGMSDFGYGYGGGDFNMPQEQVFVDDFFDNSFYLNQEAERQRQAAAEAEYAAAVERQRQADVEYAAALERQRQEYAAQLEAERQYELELQAEDYRKERQREAARAAAEREAARLEAERVEAARVAAVERAAAVERERVAAIERAAAVERDTALTQLKNSLIGINLSGLDFKIDFGNLGNVGASELLGLDRRLNDSIAARAAAEREAARLEAIRVEAARVAAEKEAARLEAARIAAEKEAARLEAIRVEAARVAAEKEAARLEAIRVEAARVAAEKEAKEAAAKAAAEKLAADKEAARVAAEKAAADKAAKEKAEKDAQDAKKLQAERVAAQAKIDRKISQKTAVTTNKKYNLVIGLDNTAKPLYGTTIPNYGGACPQGYTAVPVLSVCALDANWVFTVTATTKDKSAVKSDIEVMVKIIYTDTDLKKKYQLDMPILVSKGKNSGSNSYKLGIVYPAIKSIAVSKIGPAKKAGFIGFNDNNQSSIDTFMGKETVKKLNYDGESTLTELPYEEESEVVMTKTTLTKNLAPLVILLGAVATFFILKKIIKHGK